ncbi:lipoyltransferase 1, mitochondrial-like, partial [Oppia nitens]|uniref:lipoyltransferase 1, mitochondrial-like n=1 Tax=Oppia nitens TaxID=1686743 RepID=UPI0023DB743D
MTMKTLKPSIGFCQRSYHLLNHWSSGSSLKTWPLHTRQHQQQQHRCLTSDGLTIGGQRLPPQPQQQQQQLAVDVLVSRSDNIFANLALEDWIYRNSDLTNRSVVLLWRNRPAVVVGRHQNPWREVHVGRCLANGVEVVRRNSGGGTVYHDLQNLNISFIGHKSRYNRLGNLVRLQKVMATKFDIDLRINSREDLVVAASGHKISGTASRIGAHNSYHHLTLLIDADLSRMKSLIRKESPSMVSKATGSISSTTTNLKSINSDISMNDIINELAIELNTNSTSGTSYPFTEVIAADDDDDDDNDEDLYPGINQIEESLRSWQWIYGKTPKFQVNRQLCWQNSRFLMEIHVIHGMIDGLVLLGEEFKTRLDLVGTPFTKDSVISRLNESLNNNQTI